MAMPGTIASPLMNIWRLQNRTYLRLLTLNTLASALFIRIIFTALRHSASLSEVSQISKFHKVFFHFFGVVFFLNVGVRQQLLELLNNGRFQCFREFHMECNVHISLDKRVSQARHSLVFDYSNVRKGATAIIVGRFSFNNLSRTRLDDNVTSIQVLDFPRESTECLIHADILRDQKISSLSLEEFVVLLLDDKVDITRFDAWHFIRHSSEGDLLVVLHTLFNVHFQHFSF
mmetsp:Transcript_6017/g.12678  ORF Transcript_6017/g.12678 Transcript_6017/m.12678 type:complete len:231 (+) Transcript_6017:223-915(+)